MFSFGIHQPLAGASADETSRVHLGAFLRAGCSTSNKNNKVQVASHIRDFFLQMDPESSCCPQVNVDTDGYLEAKTKALHD